MQLKLCTEPVGERGECRLVAGARPPQQLLLA
jgi:hypothetical protein